MRINPITSVSFCKSTAKNETQQKENKHPASRLSLGFATNPSVKKSQKSREDLQKLKTMQRNFNPEADKLYRHAQHIAKIYNSPEVESGHIFMAALLETKNYIAELDEGTAKHDETAVFRTPFAIEEATGCAIFQNPQRREAALEVINKTGSKLHKELKNESAKYKQNGGRLSQPALSKRAINDIYEVYNESKQLDNVKTDTVYDSDLYAGTLNSRDKKLRKIIKDFDFDIQKAIMVDNSDKKQKFHLGFYDSKADTIWKNLSHGSDVVFMCPEDSPEAKNHVISSFINLINKPGQEYKNFDPESTEIILLNNSANLDVFHKLCKEATSDKTGKKTVIVANPLLMCQNSNALGGVTVDQLVSLANIDVNGKPNKNLRVVYFMNSPEYYANCEDGNTLAPTLKRCSAVTIPSLNASDARKYLTQQEGVNFIKSKTGREFSTETIEKSIELSAQGAGGYPDKAINLLNTASNFYIDKEDITPEDLSAYTTEVAKLNETKTQDSDISIVYDTGKRLSDIVGSPMTKADAKNIVDQIKTGSIGTKGFRAFLNNGSSYGGGRKHTAECIAGEAGIPMITIDARSFGMKDINALSQNADLPELKIKQIVANAKAQAEGNKNKTAMIYIENFDNFGADPLYLSATYEQKAFGQLLSEMDKLRKNDDINLVVVGSVNRNELIDEGILKPYKFLNSIVVYPPQDSKQRSEVISYQMDKMGLELAGDSDEQAKTLEYISETTEGFTVVDLIYLLETARNVSSGRGKDKIDYNDFTEGYLQTVSGRANPAYLSESYKKIVTSHEAGHAICLQLMYELAEKQQIPWHLPDKLNFITLDPRGDFGGAMFHKNSDNQTTSFEKVMGNIVCSYGGYAAEKTIYDISGSYGITSDMESVDGWSRFAVLDMGMGQKTGSGKIHRNGLGSPDVSQKKLETIEEDIDTIKNSARKISEMILEGYQDFILEFTNEYYAKAGTGDCTVPGEKFIYDLNQWRDRQTPEKQAQLKQLEKDILAEMEYAKNGKIKA